jgi:hypothetical protein
MSTVEDRLLSTGCYDGWLARALRPADEHGFEDRLIEHSSTTG